MNAVAIPKAEGWHLLGAFPDQEPDDVGSWLLTSGADALLLELPPGLTVPIVKARLDSAKVTLRYVTASHTHEDHLDADVWNELIDAFPEADFICPSEAGGDRKIMLGHEPVWLVKAPKHSPDDMVVIFRGVAMMGDIELGMLKSVNSEVAVETKKASMAYLRDFPVRTSYHVHTIVSAHLNDHREGVNWPALFEW
jgi:hypothetical protein